MKLKLVALCFTFVAASIAAGCTSEQSYNTGQAWERNQCNSMADQGDRERCLARIGTGYDDYLRQKQGAAK